MRQAQTISFADKVRGARLRQSIVSGEGLVTDAAEVFAGATYANIAAGRPGERTRHLSLSLSAEERARLAACLSDILRSRINRQEAELAQLCAGSHRSAES